MTAARLLIGAILVLASAPPARADDAGDPLSQSYALEAKRDYAGAAKIMRRAAQAAPRQYFLALRTGYLSALAGDAAGAVDAYHAAAELDPRAIEPKLGEQLALATLGKWPEAITLGRLLVVRDPQSYLATSRLAYALYKHKDFAESADAYQRILLDYPGDVDMRLGLGWAQLAAGKKAEAAQTFRDVLAMVPKHAGATDGLAAAAK